MTSPAPARRVLLLGGARSGKSAAAEMLATRAAAGGSVTYVATAAERTSDPEWAARIALHRDRRPECWTTVQTCELAEPLTGTGVVLVDCVAVWLTRAMDDCDAWSDDAWESGAQGALGERTDALLVAWTQAPGTVFAVSNEVGLGVVPAYPAGRRFRDELGRLNQRLAAAADEVYLVVAGRLLPLHSALGCGGHDC